MQWTFGTIWQFVANFGYIVVDEKLSIVTIYRIESALQSIDSIDTDLVDMRNEHSLTLSSSSKLNDLMLVLFQYRSSVSSSIWMCTILWH